MTSRRLLDRLLDQRNEHPERLAEIDASIRTQFETECAILVLDMCGFSRLTLKHGIVHYLSLIRRMQRVVLPAIQQHGGRVMKTEADNVFGLFDHPREALAASRSVFEELAKLNLALPEDWDVHVSIGIGYGPMLLVGDHDAFGNEMNLASKLGEDLADAGDIFLTESAWSLLGAKKRGFARHVARVSNLRLAYYAPLKRAAKKRAAKKR